MKKKWIMLLEFIVFIFIFSIIWFFVFTSLWSFFDWVSKNSKVKSFSTTYNDLLNSVYSNWYEWWYLTWNSSTWLVLYNSWDIVDYTGYMGYRCIDDWVGITQIYTGISNLNWTDYQRIFTGFTCNTFSGWTTTWWYWLNMKLWIIWRELDLKYFIYNN